MVHRQLPIRFVYSVFGSPSGSPSDPGSEAREVYLFRGKEDIFPQIYESECLGPDKQYQIWLSDFTEKS